MNDERLNVALTDDQIETIEAGCVLSSNRDMSKKQRIDGTRQMVRDLERLAVNDGCIAAAWALEYIKAGNWIM